MPCQVVNSQTQLQSRLPSLPQQLPQTQADWNSFLALLNQWGAILQQESHAPNVIPSQFQTFTGPASAAVIAALTAVTVTPSLDPATQYYGAASLKVSGITAGGTLSLAGFPISIAPASRWFCAFQINAPNGCTGTLTVKTATKAITEAFTVPASANWQQVWGLFDLRAIADTQATWEFTFTSTQAVWLDGLQMNAVGSPIGTLPKFAGTQMVTGGLAYQSNLDGVPDGATYGRFLQSGLSGGIAATAGLVANAVTAIFGATTSVAQNLANNAFNAFASVTLPSGLNGFYVYAIATGTVLIPSAAAAQHYDVEYGLFDSVNGFFTSNQTLQTFLKTAADYQYEGVAVSGVEQITTNAAVTISLKMEYQAAASDTVQLEPGATLIVLVLKR